MRRKALRERILVCLLALSALLAAGVVAPADIGGGSGKVETPYKAGTVTENDVAAVKRSTSRTRVIGDLPVSGTHAPRRGSEVGLEYVSGNAPSGSPTFELKGVDDSGARIAVDLSEVESFQVIPVEKGNLHKGETLIEVTQFPTISADELLRKRPTYSQLREHYTRSVRIWLSRGRLGDKELCLVGKDNSGTYRVIANFRELVPNSKVEFHYGRFPWGQISLPAIWWAIDSVTGDRAYPYRRIVKA